MDVRRWTTGSAVAAAVVAVPDHLQIQNTQQREWLRFTTVHINIGPGNLQELDVTGLPAGEYYLTHNADPDNHWLEGPNGEGNNFTWLRFRLDRNGANPSITELDHSPCEHPAQCGTGGNP